MNQQSCFFSVQFLFGKRRSVLGGSLHTRLSHHIPRCQEIVSAQGFKGRFYASKRITGRQAAASTVTSLVNPVPLCMQTDSEVCRMSQGKVDTSSPGLQNVYTCRLIAWRVLQRYMSLWSIP